MPCRWCRRGPGPRRWSPRRGPSGHRVRRRGPGRTPTERRSRPIAAAIRRTRSGSNEAPHASGTGYAVAPHAANPARHSSWASAGMPNRLAATMRRWVRARERAPSAGSTGAVPNGRVNWPSPWGSSSSRSTGSSMSCWCGATSPPSAEAPTHTPKSRAIFSSSVISASSASARASAVRFASRQTGARVAAVSSAGTARCSVTFLRLPSAPGPGHDGRTGRRSGWAAWTAPPRREGPGCRRRVPSGSRRVPW